MTPAQEEFVARRASQIAYWPWVGSAILLFLIGIFAFVYVRFPLYVQPSYLATQLSFNRVPQDTLLRIAAMGSLAMVGCAAFLLVIFLLIFLTLWNEKRLIVIIRAQAAELAGLHRALDGVPADAVEAHDKDVHRSDTPNEL